MLGKEVKDEAIVAFPDFGMPGKVKAGLATPEEIPSCQTGIFRFFGLFKISQDIVSLFLL
jgi:hypothetical protein